MTVFALLVGINAYRDRPLKGAVPDVLAVAEFLRNRHRDCRIKQLHDGEARRASVIDGIRCHLGQARTGDVALMWFSGHGGEQAVTESFWAVEPTGRQQSFVCADSRSVGADGVRVPDLLDKELDLLLTEVAARGAHVVAVADCCHAGGITRDLPGVAERGLGGAGDPLPASAYLPELAEHRPGGPSHVLLAACRSDQRAIELPFSADPEKVRGVFTDALLGALGILERTASYRDLLATAGSTVLNRTATQTPVLDPPGPGLADAPFLGGAIGRPARFRLSAAPGGWEVDAGRCHGVAEPAPGAPVRFAVPSESGGGLLDVLNVGAARCAVAPLGWAPDRQRTYPVVAATGVRRCGVVLGCPGDDQDALDRVGAALAAGSSTEIRVVTAEEPAGDPPLRISANRADGVSTLRVLRPDGSPATDVAGHDTAAVEQLVERLEHIARWTGLRSLDNPVSGIAGAVRMEIVPALPEEKVMPRDRPPMLPDAAGDIRLRYGRAGARTVPPCVFVRLHNTGNRPLWCVIVNLTERYRAHTGLFACAEVAAGGTAAALHGQPVEFTIPDEKLGPGAIYRDWLKLIVADEQFSELAFALPTLGGPRLRDGAARRDVGPAGDGPAGDWATAIIPVVTEIPAG